MKKNITINMFGQLYAIDEDAYELLKNYLDTIRNYFRKEEGGDEIADDIEGRIGELFSELKSQGVQAVTIEHVGDIIKRIGNPEEMEAADNYDSADSSDSPGDIPPYYPQNGSSKTASAGIGQTERQAANPTSTVKKRFYRDSKDKIIAGVLSGASKYFGGDVLAWRLGFVLFVILWNSIRHWWILGDISVFPLFSLPILLYILIAFLAPSAKTPEEKLKMKGKEVNPQNLADEVALEAKEREEYIRNGNNGDSPKGCVGGFFSVLGVFAKIFIGFICLSLFVGFIVTFVTLLSLIFSPGSFIASKLLSPETMALYSEHTVLFWVIGVCLLLIFFIPGYCAFHSLLSSSGKTANMSMPQRWLWFVLWIAAIVGVTLAGVSISKVVGNHYIQTHTHDGVFFNDNDDWRFFKRNGFKVVGYVNDEDDDWNSSHHYFTSRGEYYDQSQRYFSSWDYDVLDYYQIEREDKSMTPGRYRLTAVARTDGEGAFLYVVADSVKTLMPVPVCGNKGGNIWEEAKNQLTLHPEDSLELLPVITANDSLGYGWSRVTIDNIVLKGNTIRYGVSTAADFTGKPASCTFLDATDFKLECLDSSSK